MGGSEEPGGQPGEGAQQQNSQQSGGGAERGFPDNTPVKDMTVDQQAAYYRFQNRQADNKLAGFHGFTPQDVNAMWQRLEQLDSEKLSADQKAVREAEKSARAAADAEWKPKLQNAQLRSIAGEVLKGDDLESWMFGRNAAAFAGDDGEIDRDKVLNLLKGVGDGGNAQQRGGQPPAWGQQSGGSGPVVRPGDAGRAAAAKRFKTTTST